MKLTSLLATTIVLSGTAISITSLPAFNPNSFQASAQNMSESQQRKPR